MKIWQQKWQRIADIRKYSDKTFIITGAFDKLGLLEILGDDKFMRVEKVWQDRRVFE